MFDAYRKNKTRRSAVAQRRAVTLLAALLCLFHVAAQSVVRGTVRDVAGQPIPAATVAYAPSRGTYTDHLGGYTFELPPGRVTLTVSCIGYKTVRATIDPAQTHTRDFVLEEDAVALNVVEVHAKSRSQQLRESAFATAAPDVKAQLNQLHDLNALVGRTSGVKVREEGGVGSDFELSINGLSGNSIRDVMDGLPLATKGSGVSPANLPINLIERVEIYKGVVPAHLGADALGGAVNIITRREQRNYIDASYGIGSFHTHKADLFAQVVDPRTGLIIRPTAGINFSKNDYRVRGVELWDEQAQEFRLTDRRRFHDDYLSLLLQLEAGVSRRTWADEFFLSASLSATRKQLQTGAMQTIVYGAAERQTEAWNIAARYAKKNLILPGLSVSLSASHTWDHAQTIDTAFRKYRWDGSYIESSRSEIMGRDRMHRHYRRPLTLLRLGLDYRIDPHHALNLNYLMNRTGNRRTDEVDSDFIPSNDIFAKHTLGLTYSQSFVEDRWQNTFFVKNYTNYLHVEQQELPWITGSREVRGASTKNHTGYGLATRYAFPTDAFALKASYEHSLRLPRSRELLGNGTTVYANLLLRPENSHNLNLGLFGTLRPAPGHLLSYELNAFYRDVKDYIRLVVSEIEGTSQYDNVPGVGIRGLEGELRYTYADLLQVVANGSWEDARSMTRYYPDGKEMITYRNRIPNRPWLFAHVEATLKRRDFLIPRSTVRLTYNFDFVRSFFLTWEGYGSLDSKSRIPTQYRHDVALSVSFADERYNVSLSCNNLFDRTLYDNYKLQKPGRAFFCKFRVFIN